MASAQVSSQRSSQRPKKRKVSESVKHPKVFCRGCERPCRNEVELESHETKCEKLKLSPKASFLKHQRPRRATNQTHRGTKIALPSSQPEITDLITSLDYIQFPPLPQPKQKISAKRGMYGHVSIAATINTGPTQTLSTADRRPPAATPVAPPVTTPTPQTTAPTVLNPNPDTSSQPPDEKVCCPSCKVDVKADEDGVCCDMCSVWTHRTCLFMPAEDFQALVDSPDPWYCANCLSIRSNKIKWGIMEGEENIKSVISNIYNEVIKWRKICSWFRVVK